MNQVLVRLPGRGLTWKVTLVLRRVHRGKAVVRDQTDPSQGLRLTLAATTGKGTNGKSPRAGEGMDRLLLNSFLLVRR